MNETLTHELVHSYDYCRAHLDWEDLQHLACTEVGVSVHHHSIKTLDSVFAADPGC